MNIEYQWDCYWKTKSISASQTVGKPIWSVVIRPWQNFRLGLRGEGNQYLKTKIKVKQKCIIILKLYKLILSNGLTLFQIWSNILELKRLIWAPSFNIIYRNAFSLLRFNLPSTPLTISQVSMARKLCLSQRAHHLHTWWSTIPMMYLQCPAASQ